jgi:hypothetical protein
MDRKGGTTFSRSPLVVVWAILLAISPVRAVEPSAAAAATQLADGIWTVQGRAIQGTRRCGDWLVRLTNAGGQLSGVVSLARSSVPIQNLTLQSDGTFLGTTRAGLTGSRHALTRLPANFRAIQSALRWKIICALLAVAQPSDKPEAADPSCFNAL